MPPLKPGSLCASVCSVSRGEPVAREWPRLQTGPHRLQLSGRAEEFITAGDKFGVFLHKDLADRAEVEHFGVIAEELAVDARPHESPIGVNVDPVSYTHLTLPTIYSV